MGQTATAAVSVATFTSLAIDRDYVVGSGELQDLQVLRGVQWGSTLAFWSLYAGGSLGARRLWAREVRDAPTLGLTLAPDGLGLAGRF